MIVTTLGINLAKSVFQIHGVDGNGRKFMMMGHEVRQISPQFVKPFVKSNKNDAKDAEAIV